MSDPQGRTDPAERDGADPDLMAIQSCDAHERAEAVELQQALDEPSGNWARCVHDCSLPGSADIAALDTGSVWRCPICGQHWRLSKAVGPFGVRYAKVRRFLWWWV